MPKINVYLPDRLAEAVKRHDIAVSSVCQVALEQAVASELPIGRLTPRARETLRSAARLADGADVEHVGLEHIFIAMLDDENSLVAQVIQQTGTEAEIRAAVAEIVATSEPSNRIMNAHGDVVGYLVVDDAGEHVLVGADGARLRVVRQADGSVTITDETGHRRDPIPAAEAAILYDPSPPA